jgi:hypothetical protein
MISGEAADDGRGMTAESTNIASRLAVFFQHGIKLLPSPRKVVMLSILASIAATAASLELVGSGRSGG